MRVPAFLLGVICAQCDERQAIRVCPCCHDPLCRRCLKRHRNTYERGIGGESVRRGDEDLDSAIVSGPAPLPYHGLNLPGSDFWRDDDE